MGESYDYLFKLIVIGDAGKIRLCDVDSPLQLVEKVVSCTVLRTTNVSYFYFYLPFFFLSLFVFFHSVSQRGFNTHNWGRVRIKDNRSWWQDDKAANLGICHHLHTLKSSGHSWTGTF